MASFSLSSFPLPPTLLMPIRARWEDSLQLLRSSMCFSQRGKINSSSSSASSSSLFFAKVQRAPSLFLSPSERIQENENLSWGDPAYILFHPHLNPLINANVNAIAGNLQNKERLFSGDTNISLLARGRVNTTPERGEVYWWWYLI